MYNIKRFLAFLPLVYLFNIKAGNNLIVAIHFIHHQKNSAKNASFFKKNKRKYFFENVAIETTRFVKVLVDYNK